MNFIEISNKMNEEEIENIIFNIRHCTGVILDLIRKKQYDTFEDVINLMKENMNDLEKHLIIYRKLTAKTMPMDIMVDLLNLGISDKD
tara:strand:+ start:10923 stop:11186 length:264 start_codon:yes stop_codon:yes gene_type:complete